MGDAYIVAAGATARGAARTSKVTFYYNGWQFVTRR